VQAAEHVLVPPDPVGETARGDAADFMDEFENVSQLLRGNAHRVQPLGRVQRAGLVHRGLEPVHPPRQATGERSEPTGRGLGRNLRGDPGQIIWKLQAGHLVELPGHGFPTPPPIVSHVGPNR
jgi:hypothetical protein